MTGFGFFLFQARIRHGYQTGLAGWIKGVLGLSRSFVFASRVRAAGGTRNLHSGKPSKKKVDICENSHSGRKEGLAPIGDCGVKSSSESSTMGGIFLLDMTKLSKLRCSPC
jgi:hypothetical protein